MIADRSTLEFADGERLAIPVRPAASIYETARAAGIRLAHDCLQGVCGTCKGALLEGAVDYAVPTEDLALDPQRGDDVLACAARASAPVHIRFPYTRASVIATVKRKVRVTQVRRPGARVWQVHCRAERRIDFLPGQYLRVTPPGLAAPRAFSPASLPDLDVEFLIREVDNGAMSRYLAQRCTPGDIWDLAGPFGTFHRRHDTAPSLYVAGGTGLAPILSMLRERQSLAAPRSPSRLVFGVTRAEELFCRDPLAQLQLAMPELSVDVCVATEPVPGTVHGSVLDALSAADMQRLGAEGVVYMCGPPGMLDAVRRTLQSFGMRPERLMSEEFVAS